MSDTELFRGATHEPLHATLILAVTRCCSG